MPGARPRNQRQTCHAPRSTNLYGEIQKFRPRIEPCWTATNGPASTSRSSPPRAKKEISISFGTTRPLTVLWQLAPREGAIGGLLQCKLRLQVHRCGFHLLLRPILASNCLRDGKGGGSERGDKLPAVLELKGCRVPLAEGRLPDGREQPWAESRGDCRGADHQG